MKNWLKKNLTLEKIGLFVAIFSIWLTFYLSNPIDLDVWHNVDETNGKLEIYAKNNDLFRSTGDIEIYRIESDPNKPHAQLLKENGQDLKPRKEKLLFALNINVSKSSSLITSKLREKTTMPMYKLFYIAEETSITYKIVCDNCQGQGIVRRIPNVGEVSLDFDIQNSNGDINTTIPIYSWIQYNLKDLE